MSFSFSFVANKKRKKRTKRKRKHATASYALTSVNKMDVAGEPALLRSLKTLAMLVSFNFGLDNCNFKIKIVKQFAS